MKLFLIFFLFLSVLFSDENKKISIDIFDHNNTEWWSRFNNNGLNFTQSNISLSYKNTFDNYELSITAYSSKEKTIIGETYISFLISDMFNVKLGTLES